VKQILKPFFTFLSHLPAGDRARGFDHVFELYLEHRRRLKKEAGRPLSS
jgi:hypothetical protein